MSKEEQKTYTNTISNIDLVKYAKKFGLNVRPQDACKILSEMKRELDSGRDFEEYKREIRTKVTEKIWNRK